MDPRLNSQYMFGIKPYPLCWIKTRQGKTGSGLWLPARCLDRPRSIERDPKRTRPSAPVPVNAGGLISTQYTEPKGAWPNLINSRCARPRKEITSRGQSRSLNLNSSERQTTPRKTEMLWRIIWGFCAAGLIPTPQRSFLRILKTAAFEFNQWFLKLSTEAEKPLEYVKNSRKLTNDNAG